MHSAWIMLIIAGLLEVGWAIGLKASEGFTRPLPSVLTVVAMAGSFFLLARAMQVLPVGTAYAIWVGIGALGTVALGIVIFGESASPVRLLSALLLLAGLVGLKLSA
ncbi:MAG: quaternary ammonium compound efflux SMR transporter SugE [Pseudomonas sp.]|jgi:quaternary ammonium compound-resistance protein SugE|uniref:quaternary ammonium compound efflux SMR transporter SugE n=1 Tax=Stutzerimonas stutzeri group TaxID=136846 RepID=UPI00051D3E49|nr:MULTISPECIES: quaternary ammonium compound efflux SMR transporter SugE [Stutzerimonas stutzeri group]MDT3711120.1 quaternary ammonium compound efflux SMR transporter SugE [Pseudomonadaceae bacterium]MEB2325848.1 quaternary ammonium compound efflux SMR transporter SugE [Pseudomonas sp.]KGK82351.1 molecular chaperone [Stutzerimonas degradans]MCQ4232416.1 quaternary ammonium compound efflux SMR transporter SugE [Stutzerimonas degradans]MTZ12904.1 quaternary ammonium compound efflux SMR transpo